MAYRLFGAKPLSKSNDYLITPKGTELNGNIVETNQFSLKYARKSYCP